MILDIRVVAKCVDLAARRATRNFNHAEYDDCLQEARLWVLTHEEEVGVYLSDLQGKPLIQMLSSRVYARLADPLRREAQWRQKLETLPLEAE